MKRRGAAIASVMIMTAGIMGVYFTIFEKSQVEQPSEITEITDQITATRVSSEPLQPLPVPPKLDPSVVGLGKKLFHDPLLSADNSVSCSSCHNLANGGADGRVRSLGIHGAEGSINAPTVFNSAYNYSQFWDGRAETLEEQANAPIQNPKEMGSKISDVLTKLSENEEYATLFRKAFNDAPTSKNLAIAIATYERSLTTQNAPIDRYLTGDTHALSAEAKEGYERFKSYGCVACHQGKNIGGNMYQKLGIMGDYFADRGNVTEADYGRYNVTHEENG